MERETEPGSAAGAGTSAFIGLDIGNTRLTGCAATGDGSLIWWREASAPSDLGAEAAIPVLLDMARDARAAADRSGRPVAGIGLGFGGPVDYDRQTTRRSFHSPGWDGLALAELFQGELGVPASLDNDANAGGLGEALFGAARGRSSSLYVNVGTGVGGAVILAGQVLRGATGSAGEIGHVVVDVDGPICNCGKRGCIEAVASGTGLARAAARVGRDGLSGRGVVDAARAGDAECAEIVTRSAQALGLVIANAASVMDPAIVVLGGGVAEAGAIWLDPLRASFARHTVAPVAERTPIVTAELGYHAGVLGAAALAVEGLSLRRGAPAG